jgi:hypothetical protein
MEAQVVPSKPIFVGAPAPASADASGGVVVAPRAEVWLWVAFGVALAAAVAVFCAFDALPFMDLPAHAGLIALRHRFAASPFEQQFYVLDPHLGPYSLFRALGDAFAYVVGPVGAVRALAALSIVALPLAIVDARRRLYGELAPAFGLIGVPLGFGLMTIFGFATFLLGVAVLVECLSLWLDLLAHADAPPRARLRRELSVAACAGLLFVTHGFAFVIFLALAGTSLISAPLTLRRVVRVRALVPAVALAAYAAWIERAAALPLGSAPAPKPRAGVLFQPVADKLSLLLTPTLMTRSGVDLAIGIIIWGIAIAGVVATVRWLRRPSDTSVDRGRSYARALLASAALLALAFAVLPHEIGWFGFVDGRLVLVVLVVSLLALHPAAMGRKLAFAYQRVVPPMSGAIVLLALVTSYRFQDEARGYREVLSNVPAFARILNLPLDPNSDVFAGHPFVHYDKLVLAERPELVSDIWLHQGSALYPRAGNPVLDLPASYVSSDIRGIAWSAYRTADWDYVLIRTKPNAAPPFVPESLRLVSRVGGWSLYRTAESMTARAPAH